MTSPPPAPARPAPSSRRRILVGSLALAVGFLLLLLAVGPLGFLHRFDGRVPVTAVVTQTVSAEQAGVPAALLEYDIDGSTHLGAMLGEFTVGQQVTVDAPPDGSVYEQLYTSDSIETKVFSHLSAYLGLALLAYAVILLVRGLVQRNREVRARVFATYGARIGLRPTPPAPPPAGPPAPPPSPLRAPYDL